MIYEDNGGCFEDQGTCDFSGKKGEVAVVEIGKEEKRVAIKLLIGVLRWNASLPCEETKMNLEVAAQTKDDSEAFSKSEPSAKARTGSQCVSQASNRPRTPPDSRPNRRGNQGGEA